MQENTGAKQWWQKFYKPGLGSIEFLVGVVVALVTIVLTVYSDSEYRMTIVLTALLVALQLTIGLLMAILRKGYADADNLKTEILGSVGVGIDILDNLRRVSPDSQAKLGKRLSEIASHFARLNNHYNERELELFRLDDNYLPQLRYTAELKIFNSFHNQEQ